MKNISVVIPCLDEGLSIGKVVEDFKRFLPEAEIFVFDNASEDNTTEEARNAGAKVVFSPHKGKGNVIRHIRDAIDTEIYIIVDGDNTYQLENIRELVQIFNEDDIDMLIGNRLQDYSKNAFRKFHMIGNKSISLLVSILFRKKIRDVLSGFRIFNKTTLNALYLKTNRFEIETEMTVQAIVKGFKIKEVPIKYTERNKGSRSKLNTFGDGTLIIKTLFTIFKNYNPFFFYLSFAVIFLILSIFAGIGPIIEYFDTGVVKQVPRAVLASGLGIISIISFSLGLILDSLLNYHNELMKQILKCGKN